MNYPPTTAPGLTPTTRFITHVGGGLPHTGGNTTVLTAIIFVLLLVGVLMMFSAANRRKP